MKTLNILHISDVHIQKKDIIEIEEIVKKLIIDIKKLQNEKNIFIDLICFTGDMIQRGDNAIKGENQWELAINKLVNPILENLNLTKERFVFVPGNHEVNIDKINLVIEKGLAKIHSLQDINENIENFDQIYKDRLSYFYKKVNEQLPEAKIHNLGYSYIKKINDIEVGIACIDTAWRSSGKGAIEKGKLYIGTKQVKELYSDVYKSDIKICIMHHPLDWLEDYELFEIEKELSKFDIVLQGHIHCADLKQIARRNLKTIYNIAGKLYPLDFANGHIIDGYNGYSIINVKYDMHECSIFFRTYFGDRRNEFDVGINICKEGEENYTLLSETVEEPFKNSVVAGIKNFFHNMSEKYALIKDIDSKSPQSIRQVLVDPVLSDMSEYFKENEDMLKKERDINSIVESNENIILLGKKETGKTTTLQQIGLKYIYDFENYNIYPTYIDMRYLIKGNDRLLSSTIQFLQTNISSDKAISKDDIINLLSLGKMVFLIDNVDINNSNHTRWLKKFIETYSENRFIITVEEEFFQSIDVKAIPDYGVDFKKIYIQYMGKKQIRDMVTKWIEGKEDLGNINEIVNKIDSYFNQINFAKTPFNIAVFLVIYDENSNFTPTNEGIIMETYLEIVLEKMSLQESLRSTYSFSIKQNFLSYISYKMFLKNEYYFSKDEFYNIVKEYHKLKGYVPSKTKFDVLFFEKNILSYSGEYIVFSHTSFLEYFLAIYAYDNKEFLDKITEKDNRMYFKNEICFYAGLNKNCTELVEKLSVDILSTIINNMELVDNLNSIQIMTDFKLNKEEFISDIKNNRPTQEELDIISEQYNQYNEKNPVSLSKNETKKNNAEDFFDLLQIYGSVLKNAELLDNNYKIKHLEYYMHGMNLLYAMIIYIFDYLNEDTKFNELSDSEKKHMQINTEEEFEKIKNENIDFLKLLLPIGMQNLILENVGTPKLEVAINELIEKKKNKSFEKFMLTFLKSDLNIINFKNLLEEYIKHENSKDILKIALLKLTFYYRSRFFGHDIKKDKELIDLITDIYMKINPQKNQNFYKSKMAKIVKSKLDNKNL